MYSVCYTHIHVTSPLQVPMCPRTQHKYTLTRTCGPMQPNLRTCQIDTHTHACMHARTHACMHTRTHTRTHTHTHTHTHIHRHPHTVYLSLMLCHWTHRRCVLQITADKPTQILDDLRVRAGRPLLTQLQQLTQPPSCQRLQSE